MGAGASGLCCCCDNVNDYRTTAQRRVRGKDLSGQVFIVTGATGGLGFPITRALFEAGGTIVLASRSAAKLDKLKQRICDSLSEAGKPISEERKAGLIPLQVDLGDYESINGFVETISTRFQAVSALVNNAGMHPGTSFTPGKYGFERSFQVNLIGAVVLTEKLLPLIQEAPHGRVINLSSLSHKEAPTPPEWDNIPRTEATFGGYDVDYCEAKWLLSMYTAILAKRLEKSNAKAMDADPGVSPSSAMWDDQPMMLRIMARYICACFTHTTEQAAATAVMLCATSAESLENGGYYTNGRFNEEGLPREDCVLPSNWENFGKLIEKVLPNGVLPEETIGLLSNPTQSSVSVSKSVGAEQTEAIKSE